MHNTAHSTLNHIFLAHIFILPSSNVFSADVFLIRVHSFSHFTASLWAVSNLVWSPESSLLNERISLSFSWRRKKIPGLMVYRNFEGKSFLNVMHMFYI